VTLTRAFRGYFARREDPYAGGDLANAQRIGAVIWGLLLAARELTELAGLALTAAKMDHSA
jgi:hypothetical protein